MPPIVRDVSDAIVNVDFKQRNLVDVSLRKVHDLLNDSQINAIVNCIGVERLALIHGPPGTGKTTTLIALIEELVKRNQKILVCAPSNSAVDLLARGIGEKGIDVLRIGNVTRIGDSIAHMCLEERIRSHREWQHIKQVKIEAANAKKEAARYKRKFGPQQKKDRQAFRREARELYKWARDLEDRLSNQILSHAKVICTTLIGSAHPVLEELKFDTVVIDEASQALEPESWTAIVKGDKVIMAGDHMQLPPTVKSTDALSLGLSTTILDVLMPKIEACYLLNIQYRMNDHILDFSNSTFYDGRLNSAEFVKGRTLLNDSGQVELIDTSGCGHEELRGSIDRSYANPGEYGILRKHILSIQSSLQPPISIGVISPYAKQVGYIREELADDESMRNLDIEVNTIDGFQGQEKDVIYISLVRSNDEGLIGFLKDYRRLNVALTRARLKLVIIADLSTLGHDSMYLDLANHVELHGIYKSGWEYLS